MKPLTFIRKYALHRVFYESDYQTFNEFLGMLEDDEDLQRDTLYRLSKQLQGSQRATALRLSQSI